MVREIVQRLLKIQIIVTVFLVFIGVLLPYQISIVGIILGCGVSLLTTLMAYIFFRRSPEEISAKNFYQIMITVNLLKWLIILVVGALLMHYFKINKFEFSGIILGFGLTYLSYFGLMLKA